MGAIKQKKEAMLPTTQVNNKSYERKLLFFQ